MKSKQNEKRKKQKKNCEMFGKKVKKSKPKSLNERLTVNSNDVGCKQRK